MFAIAKRLDIKHMLMLFCLRVNNIARYFFTLQHFQRMKMFTDFWASLRKEKPLHSDQVLSGRRILNLVLPTGDNTAN